MMSLRKLSAITLVAAAVAGGSVQARTLNLGHTLSDSSHYSVGADAFAETLSRLSDGKFEIREHPSGALGGERDMIEGLQIGTVDLVITSTGPLGNFVPQTYVLDLPFLFPDYETARCVLDGPVGQDLLDQLSAHNLVGLAWSENGFRHLTNSVRPVTEPADVEGLKIRTMENKVHMEAFRQLGAHPTPMAFPELFTALQQGTVDGQENPITVILATKFWEVQDYLSLTGHVYSPAVIIASPSLWAGLSSEEKQWFRKAARASAKATRANVSKLETEGVATLREHGMEVETDLPKEAFREKVKPAYRIFTDEYGDETLNRIRNSECM
ncbi:Solute-binding protein [wastewater metagenome]|uniref:Solute-binding protein n=2 Tax=unclassified sequences TaxID=12908 RepID=A0A5B8RHU5_9ZZZZ|nr:solute-binding protein [uncultured organism]